MNKRETEGVFVVDWRARPRAVCTRQRNLGDICMTAASTGLARTTIPADRASASSWCSMAIHHASPVGVRDGWANTSPSLRRPIYFPACFGSGTGVVSYDSTHFPENTAAAT